MSTSPAVPPMAPDHPMEIVSEARGRDLHRIRVPGGWLYRAVEWDPDSAGEGHIPYAVALAFVPDPQAGT